MIYYTDDSRRRVSRFDAKQQVCETYDFTLGRWVFDTEVFGTQSGDLWLDEIGQEEAEAIIRKRDKALHR
jgi:hypothetical protein